MIHDRRAGRHIASSVVMFAGSGLESGETEGTSSISIGEGLVRGKGINIPQSLLVVFGGLL